MKIKEWTFRLTVSGLFIAVLLIVIILNPGLTYAYKTRHNNFTIYHNRPFNPSLISSLDKANDLLKSSELYKKDLELDICLNEEAIYPKLIELLQGRAFAWGFYDKVVLKGNLNCNLNYVDLDGYKWNLTQLLAHEMTHCLQFNNLGFWKSNPISSYPNWKWEGYPEYLARQNNEQKDLISNISLLHKTNNENWYVTLGDSTISPKEYYNYWLLVQYCMNVKKMTYLKLLSDSTREENLKLEMMKWYENKKKI